MPHEASMTLIRKPFQPDWIISLRITVSFKEIPQSWLNYPYWNVELG